jgi:glycosyltransferase involved in cell wall biosynthesis
VKVAHLTTVDLSLRFLLLPQLRAVVEDGGEAIGISAPGPWVAGLEQDGIPHIALASSTRGFDVTADVRSAWQLWRVLRRERPDVLHTHNPKPGLYGRIVGRLARVPIVVNTVHGLYATPDDPLARRAIVYALEAFASRFSDAELVQNSEDLALMLRLHLSPRRRTGLLGNGIDLERFDPGRFTEADRERVRRELGVLPGQLLVGTVGRLVAEEGYPELFGAMAEVGAGHVLVVVGAEDPDKPDALDRSTLERAEAMGVRFLGHRDDVDALYAAMDLFVLASHREGFPRAAMEAAAMGTPVIATDIRGCRQVVEDGVNGLLVPVRDAHALASAVRRVAADDDLRRRMGSAGVARARDQFDERRCVAIVLETYRTVAKRKGVVLGS